jgi:hypothetical protein
MILDAFEEEGWPDHIDEPLPPLDGGRESDRLRKEVYALNRRLTNPLLRFSMDGTGQGIRWAATASSGLHGEQWPGALTIRLCLRTDLS